MDGWMDGCLGDLQFYVILTIVQSYLDGGSDGDNERLCAYVL